MLNEIYEKYQNIMSQILNRRSNIASLNEELIQMITYRLIVFTPNHLTLKDLSFLSSPKYRNRNI